MRVLLISDHAERQAFDSGILNCVWDTVVLRPGDERSAVTQTIDEALNKWVSRRGKSQPYQVVIIDAEHCDFELIRRHTAQYLAPDGSTVILAWTAEWRRLLRAVARGVRHGMRSEKHRESLSCDEDWHFIVEPNLSKPHHLIDVSRFTCPGLGFPALRSWRFLLRHSVTIMSAGKSLSPLISLIRQLWDESTSVAESRKRIATIYVSSTQVLIVKVVGIDTSYFMRFPLTPSARDRVNRQALMCEYVHENTQTEIVPIPVKVKHSVGVFCAVEKGMAGASVDAEYAKLDSDKATSYFQSALDSLLGLHLSFGQRLEVAESDFDEYVEARIDRIQKRVATDEKEAAIFQLIKQELRRELVGKSALVSISHGDFKIGNCLFDTNGNISGIVDWDMGALQDIAWFDVASLLGRSLRQRLSLSLPDLVCTDAALTREFSDAIDRYFEKSATGVIPVRVLLLLYWVDRIEKQIRFDAQLGQPWLAANAQPVIKYFSCA